MIAIPYHKNYIQNSERCTGTDYPCAVCGKPVKSPRWMVRIINGGHFIGTKEEGEASPAEDLGYYPIGTDCLRRHPEIKPYVVKQ